jgi:hypothetical protein
MLGSPLSMFLVWLITTQSAVNRSNLKWFFNPAHHIISDLYSIFIVRLQPDADNG